MKELVFLLVFVVLSTAFALAALFTAFICSAKAPSEEKQAPYECGMSLFSDARVQFNVNYFNYAILFLIFDIETIFLFPFAISFNQLHLYAIIEVLIFVSLLLIALVYSIKSDLLRLE